MSCLKLYLLGPPRIELNDRLMELPRRKVMALLIYLAVTRKHHRRDTLATLLWPDSGDAAARGALRRELHALTSILGKSWFHSSWNSIGINPSAEVWLDIEAFRSLLATSADHVHAPDVVCSACTSDFCDAAALYDSGFLTGFTLADCPEFDDWQRFETESLRREFAGMLAQLVRLEQAQGEFNSAIEHARRWLALDALCEPAHCELMQLYVLAGDYSAAIRQYEACVSILAEEVGAPPSDTTTELYNAIRSRRFSAMQPVQRLEQPQLLHGQRTATVIPLVGRVDEWRQLQLAWQRAEQAGIHCAVITGEAGLGKTHLAEEMVAWAREQGIHTAQSRAYAAQGKLAYAAVVELLRTAALKMRLAKVEHVWLSHLARLLPDLLQTQPDLMPPEPVMDNWQRHQLYEALACTVHAEPHPLLVTVDDLQWSDHETIEWLHYLIFSKRHHDRRHRPQPPLLVIGTIRTGEAATEHMIHRFLWDLRRNDRLTEISLSPLDSIQVAALATQVAEHPLDPVFLSSLPQATEGNPLFIVETVRFALEKGAHSHEQQPQSNHKLPNTPLPALPPKVYALIQSRLGQLSPTAQEIAGLAAVIGRSFSFDLLAAASQLDETNLVDGLDELWNRRIIREQGVDSYDFSHDRIRDVAYSQIGRARSRLLHRRVAESLERIAAHHLSSVSGELAAHYEQAGLPKRAVEFYMQAAVTSQQVGAYQDGITLIQRGLAVLGSLPKTLERQSQELTFLLHLALLQRTIFGYAASAHGQTLLRARDLCLMLNKKESLHHVLIGLYTHHFGRGAIKASKIIAEELFAVAQDAQDVMALEEGHHAMGANLFMFGELQAAHAHFQQALIYYDRRRHQKHITHFGFDLGCFSRAFYTHLLWMLGQPEAAAHQMRTAIAQARDLGHPFTLALVLAYAAMLHQFRCEPERVAQLTEEALGICAKHGITYYEVWCTILQAWAQCMQDRSNGNTLNIQRSLERFEAIESGIRLPYYTSLLAELCLDAGESGHALAILKDAEQIAVQNDESWWTAELHRLRGELLHRQGAAPDEVESSFMHAITLARRQNAKMLEVRATVSLARLWQAQGKSQEAQQKLTALLDSFTEGGDTRDLREAQRMLDGLLC
jgi:DNA-binding SARP family transcriptional activator/predicted ATPase